MDHKLAAPLIPIVSLLVIACPNDREPPPVEDGEHPPDEVAVCLQGEPFVADGPIPVEPVGADAPHRITDLRWQAHEGCERLVIDIAAEDGSPAGAAGEVAGQVRRDLGVVRVSLRDVRWVDPDATDAAFDGPLATAAYAVWSPEGPWTYVDVHLGEEADAHVSVLADPARVVVDLRPGGGPIPGPATSDALVVVLEPRPGAAAYPLTVSGYARTFEANVVLRIEQEGEAVLETFTSATAWVDAWGHYTFEIEDGPSGAVELHVGEYSAEDGTWQGAAVPLELQ